MPSDPSLSFSLPLVACLAACLAAGCAVLAAGLVRGSTAVPAAWWAAAACLAFAAESGGRAFAAADPAGSARLRLVVLALAVCPAMSLLGAKRPQHGVWQLIVATLAVVLAMPALSAWLVRPGSLPDVHMLERSFLVLLALVGWMNFVGTRNGLSATLVTAGMLAVMRPFWPWVETDAALPQDTIDCLGACLVGLGALLAAARAAVASRRAAAHSPGATAGPARLIDPAFLALRETLGAAWALRIAERFDAIATGRGWPCRLSFHGLDAGGDPLNTSWHRDALRAFRALAHRFVTDGWLVRHGWQPEQGGDA